MEKVCDAKTIMVQYECDICHNGFMVFNGEYEYIKTDDGLNDALYTHVCPCCGYTKDMINIKYPYTRTVGAPTIEGYRDPLPGEY